MIAASGTNCSMWTFDGTVAGTVKSAPPTAITAVTSVPPNASTAAPIMSARALATVLNAISTTGRPSCSRGHHSGFSYSGGSGVSAPMKCT
jgi:hypothetical protein